jgi:hypothetical protein
MIYAALIEIKESAVVLLTNLAEVSICALTNVGAANVVPSLDNSNVPAP